MSDKRLLGPRWAPWLAFLALMMAFMAGNAWATCTSSLKVWVQPSGDTFANAYALQGEARTYFGRVEGGGSNVYKWEFSDGVGNTAYAAVGDPNYIGIDGKSFASFGTQWAKLTVQDSANPCDTVSAQINLQVIASGSDTALRQKNSAIDRGLRREYLDKTDLGGSATWEYNVASTGLALVAFENQGHNLQSPDSDIYKKSVQQGVQWLLNNALLTTVNDQRCIGDPETAASGDTMVDGLGVVFGGDNWDSGYYDGIAVLSLVNSASKAFAQSYIVAGTGVTGTDKLGNPVSLDGMSLYQVAIEAKDWISWAQSDGNAPPTTGSNSCSTYPATNTYSFINLNWDNPSRTVTDIQGYMYDWDSSSLALVGGCGGTYDIDWGDGSPHTQSVDVGDWCPDQTDFSYYDYSGPTHAYAADGTYTVQFTYTGPNLIDPTDPTSTITTSLCSIDVTVSNATGACGPTEASQGAGGWRYTSNYGSSDNSATQWDVLALTEALNRWAIDVNPAVKSMVDLWLNYSACDQTGMYGGGTFVGPGYGFGYTDPNYWCNYQKSAAGLIMMHYTGRLATDPMVVNDIAFLGNNWGTSGGDYNFGNHYGMYAMYKAMKTWNLTTVTDGSSTVHDWEAEYDNDLISRQNGDGSWDTNGGWFDHSQSTSTALAILAPGVASLPPVANPGGPYGPVSPGTLVTMDGSASYDQDPNHHIVKYEWDFDSSDGLWWPGNVAPPAGQGGTGVTTTHAYPDVGHNQTYTVTLRVTDDSNPALTDAKTTTVTVNTGEVPPVAKTNGPWTALPNTVVTFDGTGSYDPNDPAHCSGASCVSIGGTPDQIVSYQWDLDGDGNYGGPGDGTCITPDCSKVQKSFLNPVSLPARLKVCDSFGQCTVSSDSVNVVSIALVYGQTYQTCWRTAIDRFTDEIGMQVTFKNQGTGEADDVHMTLTSVPTNMTIESGAANLGTLAAGQSVNTACNPNAKTADIKMKVNKKINPTGNWTWRAVFEVLGVPYTVDNLPPIGP